jgi:D-alanyl-D-alanine carboxypeptidase
LDKTLKLFTIIFAILLFSFSAIASDCEETVVIDSVEYSVSKWWCGQKIDSTQIPVYEDFGLISKQFCFEETKIYIRKEAQIAFEKMAHTALEDSIELIVKSGYRSVGYQKQLIRKRMEKGESFQYIITYVAPPGYSEHHTGLAVDLVSPEEKYSKSKAYSWLKENASKFGFKESYPKGNTTLKTWEPWHWFYMGDPETN